MGILCYSFWIIIPRPIYAWMVTLICLSMEFSTIFLNASFFAKWYNLNESVVRNIKLTFVISWMLVRVPGTIGIEIWIIYFAERMWNEYPLDKLICIVIIAFLNLIMQSVWTVLIIKKTYNALTLTTEDDNDGKSNLPQIDLKRRRHSIDVTNVTSEAY